MRKALVQFDGSNFYNKVKKISPGTHLLNFHYVKLAKYIVNLKSYKTDACYYIGEIRQYKNNRKSEILYANQQKLFTNLRDQGIDIKLGYLLKNGNKYHEKGVDVQIAVDIVRGAIKNEYNRFYLISSDTDLLPAIKTAREVGKEVVYVAFENSISIAMSKNCSRSIILSKKDIMKFAK